MAIYHLHTSVGSRKGGQSAAAKADYILREGKYGRDPAEVEHAESGHMPAWAAADPRAYWASADAHERANGRLFREVEFALPAELTREQRARLAREFAAALTDGERLPWTLAIHRGAAKEPGKPDNPHCHLVISERANDGIERPPEQWFKRWNRKDPGRGGARKSASTHSREWLEDTREAWADLANEALRRAGREDMRIHEGTLEDQFWDAVEAGREDEAARLEREPGIHLGPAAAAIERGRPGREAEPTERGELQREAERVSRAGRQLSAMRRWIELTEGLLAAGRRLLERAEGRVRTASHALRHAARGRQVTDRDGKPMTYQGILDDLARSVRLARRARGRAGKEPVPGPAHGRPFRTRARDIDRGPDRSDDLGWSR